MSASKSTTRTLFFNISQRAGAWKTPTPHNHVNTQKRLVLQAPPLHWGHRPLVFCKTGWCKTGLSEQGYGSYMVHAWCTLRSCVLVPWYAGWIDIAVNDSHGYSMSLVCSWNEVSMSHVQVSWSPFCTRPFWRMPSPGLPKASAPSKRKQLSRALRLSKSLGARNNSGPGKPVPECPLCLAERATAPQLLTTSIENTLRESRKATREHEWSRPDNPCKPACKPPRNPPRKPPRKPPCKPTRKPTRKLTHKPPHKPSRNSPVGPHRRTTQIFVRVYEFLSMLVCKPAWRNYFVEGLKLIQSGPDQWMKRAMTATRIVHGTIGFTIACDKESFSRGDWNLRTLQQQGTCKVWGTSPICN